MKKLILVIFIFLFSCSKDSDVKNAIDEYEPLPQYTVSISAKNGGTVSNAGGTFTVGYNFSVTAAPNEGYAFDSWSDGVLDATRSFRVFDNTNLSASFFAIDTDEDGVADINDLCPNLNGSFEGVPNLNFAWDNKTNYSVKKNVNDSGCPLVSLHENGKTLIATEYASPGDYVIINAIAYLIVDNDLLNSLGYDLNEHPTYQNIESTFTPLQVHHVITTFVDDLSDFDSSALFEDARYYIDGVGSASVDVRSWDVSNVVNMQGLFKNQYLNVRIQYSHVDGIDLSYWDVSNVINMESLFENSKFTVQSYNIENWDTSRVTNMKKMFREVVDANGTYKIPISNWDVSNVEDMSQMFYLTEYGFDQNLSNWDVSNVKDMSQMFDGSINFRNGGVENGLSNWDVSSVVDMYRMFYGNIYLDRTQDLSSWNVLNVTNCQDFHQSPSFWGNKLPNFTNCSID